MQQHDFKVATPDNVSVGVTTTEILAVNSARKYAIIVNDSDETIYLAFGAAAVMHKGIRINANGGSYEFEGDKPFRGAVNGICATGSKNVCISENDD